MNENVEAIRARIASIAALAAEFAGASAQAITEQLAELMARDLTSADFGELLPEARAALETTASALCELRDAAMAREAAR